MIGWVEQDFAWYECYSAKAIATQLNNLQVPPPYTKIRPGLTIPKGPGDYLREIKAWLKGRRTQAREAFEVTEC